MSSSTVSIGTLQGLLEMRDLFSAQMDKFEARLKAVEEKVANTSRKVKTDNDKISETYKKVAASLDPVVANTQKYQKAEAALSAALKAGIIDLASHNRQLDLAKAKYLQTSTSASGLSKALNSVGSQLVSQVAMYASIGAVIGAVVSVFKQFVQANIDAEATTRRVEEAVRRYGERSGVTAKQIDEISQSLSKLSGLDDELIADAEIIGLKFNRIGSDIFPRFSKAALDLSVATGTDLSSAFEKAGKLVNQPLRALTLFAKEGYAVSKSQSDLIKNLVAAGEIELAQVEILKILEGQYGGAAVAARDTLGGAFAALGVSWENLLEKFGEDGISPIRTAIESLITLIDSISDEVSNLGIGWQTLGKTINEVLASTYGAEVSIRKKLGMDWEDLAATVKELQKNAKDAEKNILLSRWKRGENVSKEELAALGLTIVLRKKAKAVTQEQTESEAKLGDEINKVRESVNKAIDSLKIRVENARSLYAAATISVKEYNAEVLRQKVAAAIQAEENKLRAIGKTLTDQQRNSIAKAVIEEDQFLAATRRTLEARQQLEIVTAKLAKTMSNLFAAGAGGSDPAMQALLENLKEANQITADTRSEEEKRLDTVGRANELYSQGLISAESLQQIILANADQWNVELTETQLLFIKISDRLSAIAEGMAYDLVNLMADAAKKGENVWSAAGRSIKDSILSSVQDAISEWLARWFRAMAQWLVRWTATQRTAAIVSAASAGSTGGGGAGGASGLFGMASQAYGAYSGGSGAGASAGTLAGYAVAAYALYVVYKGFIEDHKRKFGSVTISDGVASSATGHGSKYIKQVQEAASQLLKSLASFTSQLDIDMKRYGTVILEASKSGFNVKFSSTSSGKLFKSIEEAQEYAQVLMLKYGDFADSVSFLVQSVIKSTKAINLEQLASDIDFANILDTQNMESIAQEMKSALDLAMDQWKRAKDLWLDVYDTNLPAFAEAAASIITKLTSSLSQQFNSLMGIKEDPKAAWQRQALAYNAQRAIVLAQIKLWELEIAARIANYNATRTLIGGGGGGGGKGGGNGGGYIGITQGFTKFVAAFVETTMDVIDPAFQALLDIQALLQDAAANIPGMIDPTKYPGTKGAGGGGGNRDSVRDWVNNKRYDLDTRSLDEWAKKAKDIAREYDEQIKLAGKDKKLREELLALKERELELLQKEQVDNLIDSFKNFLGLVSPFDSVRKTAQDLIKQIEASPFGNDRKAKMIGRVLADLDRQIQDMSDRMASDLFGSIAGMLEDSTLKTDILRAQFVLNWQLQLADAKARYAMLLMEGKLTEENRKLFEDAIKILEGIDPEKVFGSGGSGSGGSEGTESGRAYTSKMERMAKANEDYIKRMQSARDLLKKYTDQGVSSLTLQLREIDSDFKLITDSLGSTADIISEKNEAISRAYADALSGVKDIYDSLLNGPASALTVEKQFQAAKSSYESLVSQVLSGDYTNLDDLDSAAQSFIDLLGQMYGTSTGGFITEREKILSQLSELLKLGDVGSGSGNNVIQFPYNNPANTPSVIGNNIVAATGDVGKIIDMRGVKQERLLTNIENRLLELQLVMEAGNANTMNTNGNGITLTYG